MQKALGRRLDAHVWCLAWDSYALAGAVLNQFTFQMAMKHKAVVMEIAVTAQAENRGPLLGMLYDEIARCVCSLTITWFPPFSLSAGKSGKIELLSWGMPSTFPCKWESIQMTFCGGLERCMILCVRGRAMEREAESGARCFASVVVVPRSLFVCAGRELEVGL